MEFNQKLFAITERNVLLALHQNTSAKRFLFMLKQEDEKTYRAAIELYATTMLMDEKQAEDFFYACIAVQQVMAMSGRIQKSPEPAEALEG